MIVVINGFSIDNCVVFESKKKRRKLLRLNILKCFNNDSFII